MSDMNSSALLMEQATQDAWDARINRAKSMAPVDEYRQDVHDQLAEEIQGGKADLDLFGQTLLDWGCAQAMLRFFWAHVGKDAGEDLVLPAYFESGGMECDLEIGKRLLAEIKERVADEKADEWAIEHA